MVEFWTFNSNRREDDMPRKKKGVFSFGRATPLANEHKRFGGRGTRQNSKLGKAISLQRLEKLLRQKKASGSE